ncbi:MAG TPA: crosslink repair DNA glycosylase YcaQ family protein [Nocardioidaceae bacterium]|nr:crosslink repair DNA glycosylase YcaQ family protein [Nocardioidaceae bacterium]
MRRLRLSKPEARRIALAAQGFADPAPTAEPTMRTLTRTFARTGVLQVDSVNVLIRAQYLPLYSRMGPYDTALLRRAAQHAPRRMVEYWAHVQALMPVELWPMMRHRMERYRTQRHKWWGTTISAQLTETLLAEIADRGAATARDLDDGLPRVKGNWGWNWSTTRRALDYLYMVGDVAVAGRNGAFEIRYDLPERVLPRRVLEAPPVDLDESNRELVRRAARSCGVASARCLVDYYRMQPQPGAGGSAAKQAIADLVESGELIPVAVDGWQRPAYLHRDARRPRRLSARALLSPFDPLVWERDRTEALFDFRYRIEIYTPPGKRVYGYYVLPFLLGDRLVARVDLKAERTTRRLLVQGAFAEPGAPPETTEELAAELGRLARWLGLDEVTVRSRGDLGGGLAARVAAA